MNVGARLIPTEQTDIWDCLFGKEAQVSQFKLKQIFAFTISSLDCPTFFKIWYAGRELVDLQLLGAPIKLMPFAQHVLI